MEMLLEGDVQIDGGGLAETKVGRDGGKNRLGGAKCQVYRPEKMMASVTGKGGNGGGGAPLKPIGGKRRWKPVVVGDRGECWIKMRKERDKQVLA